MFEAAALGREAALIARLDEETAVLGAWSPDGFQPIHLAAFFGRVRALDILIARGGNVNVIAKHPAGMAPIHSAAASRRCVPVRSLLAAGAEPDPVQAGGYTALMSAAAHGLEDMVDALLAAGADPGRRADNGRGPAELARAGGNGDLAARLDRLVSSQRN